MSSSRAAAVKPGARDQGQARDSGVLSDLLNMLELILDQAYLGLVFVDTKGIIRFMNQQYEDLIGVPRQETYGKHITEYFPDSRLPLVIETQKPEMGWKYDYRGRGTLVVNRIPIIRDGELIGALTQCIFRDISELKDMAKDLDILQKRVRSYQHQLSDLLTPKYTFKDILGVSEGLNHAKDMAQLYAGTESAVLITGETGTGKELFAHAIHNASPRRDGPFVCLNCAAIPSELLESELFGYAAGAFTGARNAGKMGKLQMARGGSIFLDEIAELPLVAQAKLLRVLEDKRIDRLGSTKPEDVDFRLIAATNREIKAAADEGGFRKDLYFRLSALNLHLPPLREREQDILVLLNDFAGNILRRSVQITDTALSALQDYPWPGNIRELKNVVELACCLIKDQDVIDLGNLPPHIIQYDAAASAEPSPPQPNAARLNLKSKINEDEIILIKRALAECKGNKSAAASRLGISRSSLYNKMRRYDISA
ncbi:MAG: sigma 54-interacting transcriptional regulator [Deltaproteobacteria bacterium]|nr:sigma 54-interacting transcriptional regulator [Deltaproteobacteria bacterium]